MGKRSKMLSALPAFLLAAYPMCVVLGWITGAIIADFGVIGRDEPGRRVASDHGEAEYEEMEVGDPRDGP